MSSCQTGRTEDVFELVSTSTENDSVYENVKTATDQSAAGCHYSSVFCIRTTQAFLRLQGLVCNNQ